MDDQLGDLWVGPEGSGPVSLGDDQVGQGWCMIRVVVG